MKLLLPLLGLSPGGSGLALRAGPHWSFPQLSQKLDAGNQLALIEELHKEIRFIGNECKGEHVPGFCLPKKVSGAWCTGCWVSARVCSRTAAAAASASGLLSCWSAFIVCCSVVGSPLWTMLTVLLV